jgi:BirA family biotin operon repressor/biotin-[acetyl-CoA-carboxylase] ligase
VLPIALLQRLADGREYPRTSLRESLGLKAAEFDRQLDRLIDTGLAVLETADERLRLADAIDWIDVGAIESALKARYRERIESLTRAVELDSTNRHLLTLDPPAPGLTQVAIAEYQSAGRGRHGRRWSMPPGSGIALSASWTFDQAPADLAALSLAVGAAARRAVFDVTGLEIGLKWPNDLFVDDGKLGGILVELATLANGACHVVAGIGINVRVPPGYLSTVSDFGHGARDLSTQAPQWAIDRPALAAALIEQFVELFSGYAGTGFEPYRAEWLTAHILDGKAVELRAGEGVDYATVCGIGNDGALIVEDRSGKRRRILSGDVTIRAKQHAGD